MKAAQSPPTGRLLVAMRELAAQSERVARAEARVVASRVTEVAQASLGRVVMALAAGALGTLAVGFALVAAYDALAQQMPGWQAALIVAGTSVVAAALCAWRAMASPSGSSALEQFTADGEQAR